MQASGPAFFSIPISSLLATIVAVWQDGTTVNSTSGLSKFITRNHPEGRLPAVSTSSNRPNVRRTGIQKCRMCFGRCWFSIEYCAMDFGALATENLGQKSDCMPARRLTLARLSLSSLYYTMDNSFKVRYYVLLLNAATHQECAETDCHNAALFFPPWLFGEYLSCLSQDALI